MKKLIFAIALVIPLTVSAAATIQPVRVPVLAQLQMFWTVLCEDVWGGTYGYEQTEDGPTGWSCTGGTRPEKDD